MTKLTQTDSGWRVATANDEAEFGAVIYCGTAYKLAELELRRRSSAEPARGFGRNQLSAGLSVVLGFRRESWPIRRAGFRDADSENRRL